jgi:hypothetical protein
MRGKKLSHKETIEKLEIDAAFRREIFKNLLEHIREGYSLDCFSTLSDKSILEYTKTYPNEFDAGQIEIAMRDAKVYWEGLGRRQAEGSCLGNSRSWYYNMVNRYNWHEKAQVSTDNKHSVEVNIIDYASTKKPKDTQGV